MFFNLRKIKGHLQAIDDGDLSPENVKTIADNLNVPESEVISMNRRLAGPDNSLNAPLKTEGDGEWQDWLVDERANQEELLGEQEELEGRRNLLNQALVNLNERERHIFVERRLTENPKTLEELSEVYNISRERVRQIEVRSFEKVQTAIKAAAL